MNKDIVINVGTHEKRIAVVEDGKLEAFMMERPDSKRLVGNIYIGTVQKVHHSIQAVFVDIGLEKSAFLPFSNVFPSLIGDNETEKKQNRYNQRNNLRKDQKIIVQVIKEPISTKGCKVSMQLSFTGRFMVLLSGTQFIGVSKKTKNVKERRGLKEFIRSIKPEDVGVIVRTIGLEAAPENIEKEIKILYDKYTKVVKLGEKAKKPSMLYKEIGLGASAIRELFTSDVSRVAVDDKKEYKEIQNYLKPIDPELCKRVVYYQSKITLFDYYGIEKEVNKILRRKVWMKNGGYLIFDNTEALIAIDVNSGRFSGKKGHDDSILAVNMESVREIARQIRLRDIGGLIVIDLIDMEILAHRKKVYDEFCKAMSKDKSTHNIGKISEFGTIILSRKRIRPELVQILSEVCTYCGGTGTTFSPETVVARMDRYLHRNQALKGSKNLEIEVSNSISEYLNKDRKAMLKKLIKDNKTKISIIVNEEYHNDEFRIYDKITDEDITDKIISDY